MHEILLEKEANHHHVFSLEKKEMLTQHVNTILLVT